MTRFVAVEMIKKPVVRLFSKHEYFKMDRNSLVRRIQNAKRDGLDTFAEEKALEALNEVMKNDQQ